MWATIHAAHGDLHVLTGVGVANGVFLVGESQGMSGETCLGEGFRGRAVTILVRHDSQTCQITRADRITATARRHQPDIRRRG